MNEKELIKAVRNALSSTENSEPTRVWLALSLLSNYINEHAWSERSLNASRANGEKTEKIAEGFAELAAFSILSELALVPLLRQLRAEWEREIEEYEARTIERGLKVVFENWHDPTHIRSCEIKRVRRAMKWLFAGK